LLVDLFDKIFVRYSEESNASYEINEALKALKNEFNTIKTMYQTALESTESVQGETLESGLQDGVYNKKQSVAKNSGRIYNKNTDQYRVMWTIEEGALTKDEVSEFYENVFLLNNDNFVEHKLSQDGEYIFEINNKMVYSEVEFYYPRINKVIAINVDEINSIKYA